MNSILSMAWKVAKPLLLAEGGRMLLQMRNRHSQSRVTPLALVGVGLVGGAAAVLLGSRFLTPAKGKTASSRRRTALHG